MTSLGFIIAVLLTAVSSRPEVTNAIRVNQLGYPSAARKLAMVVAETAARRFSVHRADGVIVLEGELSPPVHDKDSGDRIQIADFSALTGAGRYALFVPDVGWSSPFEIQKAPYGDLLRLSTRAYYGQRCGAAVELGSGYAHPACHLIAAFHPSSGKRDGKASIGGWHDAGDYGRYVVNSGITIGTLLWAWELFPNEFSELNLDIPESNNRIPDFLDEIRWNLEWMLSMQDRDGGVWHKQTSEQFAEFVMPHHDKSVSYVIGTGAVPFKSSCATADLAAVMAIAARVYRSWDEPFAQRCLEAARRGWAWVNHHPSVIFRNPAGIETGEYGDLDCRDERLWAAAELWRSSEDREALRYFLTNLDEVVGAIGPSTPPSWQEVGALAGWTYVLSGRADPTASAKIRRRSVEAADAIVYRSTQHPYRIPLTSRDYIWGSNGVALNYGVQLLIANQFQADARYIESALNVLHYIFGRNALAISWVTGAGSRSVRDPHHRPSASDGVKEPWPGLLAGGPNSGRQDPMLKELPTSTPPARMYLDDRESFAGNEVAINWNAPLVFVLAGSLNVCR